MRVAARRAFPARKTGAFDDVALCAAEERRAAGTLRLRAGAEDCARRSLALKDAMPAMAATLAALTNVTTTTLQARRTFTLNTDLAGEAADQLAGERNSSQLRLQVAWRASS